MRILLVEDDQRLVTELKPRLQQAGFWGERSILMRSFWIWGCR
jgi:DNA-binding response OmpR family regulator